MCCHFNEEINPACSTSFSEVNSSIEELMKNINSIWPELYGLDFGHDLLLHLL